MPSDCRILPVDQNLMRIPQGEGHYLVSWDLPMAKPIVSIKSENRSNLWSTRQGSIVLNTHKLIYNFFLMFSYKPFYRCSVLIDLAIFTCIHNHQYVINISPKLYHICLRGGFPLFFRTSFVAWGIK